MIKFQNIVNKGTTILKLQIKNKTWSDVKYNISFIEKVHTQKVGYPLIIGTCFI